jgi:hypothetical protein
MARLAAGSRAAELRGGWRREWRWLFCRDQSHLAGDALPGLAVSDPGVNKALTLRDAFSVLGFFDAKDVKRDGRIAVDFGADVLIGQRLIERFGVLGFNGPVLAVFEGR